jgi:hypothetical protein
MISSYSKAFLCKRVGFAKILVGRKRKRKRIQDLNKTTTLLLLLLLLL